MAGRTVTKPKIALVHDWLVSSGGAERVLLALHELWPEAPIYTAAYAPEKFPEFQSADVRTTWLNKIVLAKRKHQLFSIPRAWAFKGLDLSEYDVVISSSSAEAKYVKTGPNTVHICYCHTPIRYYFSDYDWYRAHPPFGFLNPLARLTLPILIPFLRKMDFMAAQKVDYFIANSSNVKKRIKRYYKRDATVIYPPVNTERFMNATSQGKYYLVLGRQVAYKRLDIVVDAFNELGLPLKVVGTGEEIAKQKTRSKSNIMFAGRVSDEELPDIYGESIAFVFPAEEDFGIVMVESLAAGKPVIAYRKGGALEIIEDDKTGLFFDAQDKSSLVNAIRRFEKMSFDSTYLKKSAERFDVGRFKREMREYVESQLAS